MKNPRGIEIPIQILNSNATRKQATWKPPAELGNACNSKTIIFRQVPKYLHHNATYLPPPLILMHTTSPVNLRRQIPQSDLTPNFSSSEQYYISSRACHAISISRQLDAWKVSVERKLSFLILHNFNQSCRTCKMNSLLADSRAIN